MKRLSTLLMACCSVALASAQLNGDGFYRVQNSTSTRYITVIDNKSKGVDAVSTKADLHSVETVKGFNKVASNMASIIYIEKTSQGYVLRAQGADSYKFTGYYLQIGDNKDGTYKAYGSYKGQRGYLRDEPWSGSVGAMEQGKSTDTYTDWNIIPLTQSGEQYFGLTPQVSIGDAYYAAFCSPFTFSLASPGMKAYYVDRVAKAKEGLAELVEITGDVPANTAVVVKCSSNNPANNKLTFKADAGTAVQGTNLLTGVYFKYEGDDASPNHTPFTTATMRVLGKTADGSIGYVKAPASLAYMDPNVAYLRVPSGYPDELKLLVGEDFATGIAVVDVAPVAPQTMGVYTLSGVRVADSLQGLPAGVYVAGGKKVVVK